MADSCSSANCLMVSYMPYLVRDAAWLTTTSDLRTNESSSLEQIHVVGIFDDRGDAGEVEPAGEH